MLCKYCLTEILPLVEFELELGITDEEAEKLIEEPIQSTDDSIETENQFNKHYGLGHLFCFPNLGSLENKI